MSKTYSITVRNKFISTGAEDLDQMIQAVEGQLEFLKKLKDPSVTYVGGMGDDYASFTTENQELAEKLGFSPVEDDDEDEEEAE